MFARILPVLVLGLGLVQSGVAAEETQKPTDNWMRAYVEQRKDDVAVRALSSGTYAPRPVTRVTGGKPAQRADNPFTVGLLFKDEPNDFFAQYCAGTLIKPDVVVTAAHCSDFVLPGEVQVLTRTRRLNGSGMRRDVSRIIIHPAFDRFSFSADVAVWHLKSKEWRVPRARLALNDGPVGRVLLVTGWGQKGEYGPFPRRLLAAEVPLVPRSECRRAYGRQFQSTMICAGVDAGGVDTCPGDSGGPLARGNRLLGISSWGVGCGRPEFPGVYTRISNRSVLNFIRRNDR
jgi:secreted trypsin-like serine protease